MLKKYLFLILPLFFLIYLLFWLLIFKPSSKFVLEKPIPKYLPFTPHPMPRSSEPGLTPCSQSERSKCPDRKVVGAGFTIAQTFQAKQKKVLSANIGNEDALPDSYKISLAPRQQAFNLSCEFAGASAIIYHFTNNPDYAPKNEKQAEEILMGKIGVSENPNIGIRMGSAVPGDNNSLLKNLNEKFGGSDYYGVHAPPFIDLFKEYKLAAKPLDKKAAIHGIQKAIYSGHLVMAWIKIGFGKDVDLSLSYGGSIPIIKGEHVVVIKGYDQNGVFIMDPGSGKENYLKNDALLEAAKPFLFPFLEVFPANSYFSFDPSGPLDLPTGINRGLVKVRVENATKIVGKASETADILKEFGYRVIEIKNSACTDCENIRIKIKNNFKDYVGLLKRDFSFASFSIDDISVDLSASESADMVVVVGEE